MRTHPTLAASLLLSCATACLAGEAPEVPVEFSRERLSGVKAVLVGEVEKGAIPGGMVLVANRGRVVLYEEAGFMDREAKRPMRRDTIFRAYSMTKPITAVAALQLYEQGKLDLDDPVAKYLPALAGVTVAGATAESKARPMTIRDLLRHTAGLSYGWGASAADEGYRKVNILDPEAPLKSLVKKLGGIQLDHPPGTVWKYSISLDVLGRVIEVVSKKSLGDYFEAHIFAPLGMKDTAFQVPPEKLSRFAANYSKGQAGLSLLDAPAKSRFAKPAILHSGGGGLVSTIDDYLSFAQALLHGGTWNGKRVLRAKTVALMTSDQLPKGVSVRFAGREITQLGYGLGVSVWRQDAGPYGIKGEFGWGGAASTSFWISPADKLIVLTVTQVMPRTRQLDLKVKPLVYSARRRGPF
ncbi:MAG: beta-lactamase family protein [Planctomycetes bacterium]|nr:beta-lactamase family protein [Planctomycetota bacterium]